MLMSQDTFIQSDICIDRFEVAQSINLWLSAELFKFRLKGAAPQNRGLANGSVAMPETISDWPISAPQIIQFFQQQQDAGR